jgi:signal transduction histidine kinase
MEARDVPVDSSERRLRPEEAARLEAMRRLSMGAAHTLNNAFAALLGEARSLLEDRKRDPLVVEACHAMLDELGRCTRLTRALLARREPSQSGSGEVDMVRLVRELGDLLSDTLGRQHQLAVDAPDDLLLVEGDAVDLELLVLALVYHAADHAGGPTRLTLSVSAKPEEREIRLSLAVDGRDPCDRVAEAVLDPSLAPDEISRASLEGAARIVRAHGGTCCASSTKQGRWTALVLLPALQERDTAA